MDTIGGDASSGDEPSAAPTPLPAAAPQTSTPSAVNDEPIPNPSETRRTSSSSMSQDGSASDISMAAATEEDPSTPEPAAEQNSPPAVPDNEVTVHTQGDIQDTPSRKRKSPGQDPNAGDAQAAPLNPASGSSKRAKLDADQEAKAGGGDLAPDGDRSLLPPEIWHHVFTFCPPKTLGNLLLVNKLFHVYLDPSSSVRSASPRLSPGKSAVGVLKPNSIWQASRRLFWSHMPAPLRSMTELESWRLACSTRCQACGKQDESEPQLPPDPWHQGPGMEGGVSVIWPFAIRACGSCLLSKSVKEVDLLISSSVPSAIIPALPFIFSTQELHAVSASTLENAQPPSSLKLTKFFLASDVDELKEEFNSVREMGAGTAEEWFKGLEGRGKDHRAEAAKWEKWDSSGGRISILAPVDPVLPPQTGLPAKPPPPVAELQNELPQSHIQVPDSPPGQDTEDSHPNTTDAQHSTLPQARQERTIEEVASLKAVRKSEIERRASLLVPPLKPSVLGRMPSFQAATQLITPLDDNAWELLKPRLEAQRADAEQQEEAEGSVQGRPAQAGVDRPGLETTLATTKAARDLIDKDWEEVQAPLRASIADFADEIIRSGWDNGKKVTKETCSKFAVDALVHVRKKFYAQVAEDAAAAQAAGREYPADPPEGPFTKKLTLENMKWIFDAKIKPHTDPFKKELFYCNGCEGNYKAYGFEGVIQHYAAKHTSALSVGSIVVHWRAEWPEVPPFAAQARNPKTPFYGQGPPPFPPGLGPGPAPAYSYGSYQPPPGPAPSPQSQSFPPGTAMYGAPSYAEQYPQPPYQQGAAYPPPSGLPPQPYPPQPVPAPYPGYQAPPPPPPNGAYPTHQTPSTTQGYQPIGPSQPPPAPGFTNPPAGQYAYNYSAYQGNGQVGYAPPPTLAYPDLFRVQLEDVVKNSREIWNSTANIKDLPGSVRVFTTIHNLVKRFQSRFSETPSLELFNEGLSNNKEMRPVRNINALTCRACHFGLGNAPSIEQDKKSFSLPQLVNHFQSKHVEPMQRMAPHSPPLDWTVDMLLLPDSSVLAKLPGIVGPDSQKRYLFSEAFPEFFYQASSAAPTGSHYPQQAPYSTQYEYPPAYQGPHISDHGYIDPQPQPGDGQITYSADHNHYQTQAPPGASSQSNYDQGPPQNSYASAPPQTVGQQTETVPPAPALSRSVDNKSQSSWDSGPGAGSKGGRGKNSGPSSTQPKGNKARRAEKLERRREKKIKAMWAADRSGTAQTASASGKSDAGPELKREPGTEPDRWGRIRSQENSSRDRTPTSSKPARTRTPPRRDIPKPHKAKPSPPPQDGLNLLDALEMHLQQERLPADREPRREPPSRVIYVDGESTSRGAEPRREDGYAVYPSDHSQARPPPARYEVAPAAAVPVASYRERSPGPRQGEADYYSRAPAGDGVGEVRYVQASRSGPDQYEPVDRRPDVHPHDVSYRRAEEIAYAAAPQNRQEYYRPYPDEPPPRARMPAEAYELVRVIDSQGEYYIRRPVRQDPEPRYVYEDEQPIRREPGPETRYIYESDRPARREPEGYPTAGYEPVYSRARPLSPRHQMTSYDQPPRPEYPPRGPVRPETTAAARYDEEYDPRFPAAASPTGGPPRQVRYQ